MAKLTDENILDKLDDIEEPSIIRIYSNIIRTKYKRRDPYAYPKHLVPVSARYNELIVDFLQRPLEEKICIFGETMYLALTKQNEATQNKKVKPVGKRLSKLSPQIEN
jgi:hypothetical protein